MSYEIINEELKIAACSIADLTMEQVKHFLNLWEEGSSIGTLTLFYDERGYLVLNRDNENYSMYLDIAEGYLLADENERTSIREKAPEGAQDTLRVLDGFIALRETQRELFIIKNNYIDESYNRVLGAIYRKEENMAVAMRSAFRYGLICGKRAERKRRKKTA